MFLLLLQVQEHPGEIKHSTLDDMRRVIAKLPTDDATLASWFGRFISTPRGLPEPTGREPAMSKAELQATFQVREFINAYLRDSMHVYLHA